MVVALSSYRNYWFLLDFCFYLCLSTFALISTKLRYFLCLLLLGIPLFFMENVLGQYTGTSATKVCILLGRKCCEFPSDLPSPCPRPRRNGVRPPLHPHHDRLLLHRHHGLGILLHVSGLYLYFYWYLYLSVINDEISHLCASLLVKTQAEQMRHHRVCPI